jgi:hypothetical protein
LKEGIEMKTLHRIFLAAALLSAPGAALASDIQIGLDLINGLMSPGDTITFTGTVSNLDTSLLYLNSCSVNLTGLSVSGDCSLFLTSPPAPISLDPLQTGIPSFQMFTVTADLSYLDSLGVQSGSFDVLGGADPSDQNLLGSAAFSVDVETPEPSSALLLLSGVMVLVLRLRPDLVIQSVIRADARIPRTCQERTIPR